MGWEGDCLGGLGWGELGGRCGKEFGGRGIGGSKSSSVEPYACLQIWQTSKIETLSLMLPLWV